MCGENSSAAARIASVGGSSPRVRGKPPHRRRSRHTIRLIPACAGKTNILVILLADPTAHPRVCGENGLTQAPLADGAGSSPRVRGKLGEYGDLMHSAGLIPACAGKTCQWCFIMWDAWAHPRVCGENCHSGDRAYMNAGSSPRVRGKRPLGRSRISRDGLIPACAGKTFDKPRKARLNWAHPRVCGENSQSSRRGNQGGGSSPRVRGKPRPSR